MTEREVAKLVAVLIAAFPNSKISPETSAVYERMLRDLDYAAANAAIERLLATSKWLPTVAEIREAALTLHTGEIQPGGDAWGEVLRLQSPRDEAEFERLDPVIARCIDRLGMLRRDTVWRAGSEIRRCRVELGDNETADRARFIELYDQLAATQRRAQLSESLPAMQRFRALQAQQQPKRLEGEARPLGKLLPFVTGSEP